MTEEKKGSHALDVWKGVGFGLLLHLVLLIYPPAYFLIGVAQLIYVIPALIYFRKRTGIMQGIIIVAVLTFLLNAACFGIVFSML